MINSRKPAMPLNATVAADLDAYDGIPERFSMPTGTGITKLEHFAGVAMQGLIMSNPDTMASRLSNEQIVTRAYEYADLMCKEGGKV